MTDDTASIVCSFRIPMACPNELSFDPLTICPIHGKWSSITVPISISISWPTSAFCGILIFNFPNRMNKKAKCLQFLKDFTFESMDI